MAQTNNQNTFNFATYNELMKQANSGLQLFLALQQLQNVEQAFRRFNSPFAKEVIDLVDEITDLRNRVKAYVAKRENSGNTEAIDNLDSLKQASTSADASKIAA